MQTSFAEAFDRLALKQRFGDHYARLIDLLYDGVAFKDPGHKTYSVYSHEGDELAEHIPTSVIEPLVHVLRLHGHDVGSIGSWNREHPGSASFTLAWRGRF